MSKIQIRRDTADFWEGANPVLAEGELGLELGSFKFKVGDGTKAWNDLDYIFVDAEIPTDILKSGDNVSELVNDAGYLTTALQSGDNISELTNDVGYVTNALQSGDNISKLVNDVGYLVTALQSGDNVSRLFNDAGYLNQSQVNQIIADGGFLTDALQSGDNVSELVNDAGYLTTGLQSGDNVSELTNDAGYLIDSDVDQILTDGGYLTTAVQPGDNVSDLNNDAGYLTIALQSGDNISELVNDAGYLTTGLQSGDNVSELVNDANYLTTSSSIGDLGDVTMDNIPPTGHYLKWDGSSWVSAPGPVTEGEAVGIELTDLSAATVAPGVTSLTYNNVSGVFTYTPPDLSAYLTSYTEIDPVFTASPAFGISGDDIANWNTAHSWGDHASVGYWIDDPISRSNWDTAYGWGDHSTEGYLTSFTETDPVFTASPAFGISGDDITNWNTSYGWGDHAAAGYLTSFTETDPVFSSSPAFGILTEEIDNWNTAHSWGDHSVAGYATTTQLNSVTANSANWDTAFSWGDHAAAGYVTGTELSNATSNSTNWDTAFSWGDHAAAGYATTTQLNSATANSSNWDTAYSWGDHSTEGYLTSDIHVINVKDYGAIGGGDPNQNDSPAIQSAFDAAQDLLRNGKPAAVYFPTGIYYFDSKVVINVNASPANNPLGDFQGLTVFGDGTNSSLLVASASNSVGILEITSPGNTEFYTVRDMSFLSPLNSGDNLNGTALEINSTLLPGTVGFGDTQQRTVDIRNIRVAGYADNVVDVNQDAGRFEKGIVVQHKWYPSLDNVVVKCAPNTSQDYASGRYGIHLFNCYSPEVNQAYVHGPWERGINHVDDGADTEDFRFNNSFIVGPAIGIYIDHNIDPTALREPGGTIIGNHVNCIDRGIMISKHRQVNITNNYFYMTKGDVAAYRTGVHPCIHVKDSDDIIISNNQFCEPGFYDDDSNCSAAIMTEGTGGQFGGVMVWGSHNTFNHGGISLILNHTSNRTATFLNCRIDRGTGWWQPDKKVIYSGATSKFKAEFIGEEEYSVYTNNIFQAEKLEEDRTYYTNADGTEELTHSILKTTSNTSNPSRNTGFVFYAKSNGNITPVMAVDEAGIKLTESSKISFGDTEGLTRNVRIGTATFVIKGGLITDVTGTYDIPEDPDVY